MNRRTMTMLVITVVVVVGTLVGLWLIRRSERSYRRTPYDLKDPDVRLAAMGLIGVRSTCERVPRFLRTKAMDGLQRLDSIVVSWKAQNPGKSLSLTQENALAVFLDPAYRSFVYSILPIIYDVASQAVMDLSPCPPDTIVVPPWGQPMRVSQFIEYAKHFTSVPEGMLRERWDMVAGHVQSMLTKSGA